MEPDELPYLATFARAAELGNFTAAGRELGITQAAVSQRIHALEASLGTPLFDRRGGSVTLTEAGRKLHGFAQRILDLARQARQEIAGQDSPVSGELLLAASSIPGEHFLPALLAAFGQRHPEVRIRATVGDSAAVIGQVGRGEAHLGLVGRKADDPALLFQHLASDRMVFVVPPGHPLAGERAVTAERLAAHPLVLREQGSGLRQCLEKALERIGRSLAGFRVALEIGSNEALKEAVLRGVGVGVLSIHAVRKEAAAGSLAVLEGDDLKCDRDMFVVHDRGRPLPVPARTFLAFLRASPIPAPSPARA
ncbi:MAG: LysR family transcriptional regulator [Gemmataceae bacterium]|nr:LysR family transcriptional regulator [Gemmataceae bacterium]